MPETKRYGGGCHCGKVRYEVTSDLARVYECNCSICSKRGYLLTFVEPDDFTLLSGADDVTDYQFHKRIIHHEFCKHCGIASHGHGTRPDGKAVHFVNVRCLDDVELSALTVKPVDGKKL